MSDLDLYAQEYANRFEYDWVTAEELTSEERDVWRLRNDILALLNEIPEIEEIKISETMRLTGSEDWIT